MQPSHKQSEEKIHPYKNFFQTTNQSPSQYNDSNNIKFNSQEFFSQSDDGSISQKKADNVPVFDTSKDSLGLGLSFEEINEITETGTPSNLGHSQEEIPTSLERNSGSIGDNFNSNNNSLHPQNVYKSNPESPIRTTRTIISLNSSLGNTKPREDFPKIASGSMSGSRLEPLKQEPNEHITKLNTKASGNLQNINNNKSSTSVNFASLKKKRSRSVDLSHMYLLNSHSEAQLTSTNESVADLSHQIIKTYLGEGNDSILVPRLKTIEMYKDNVKKSKDPIILFEFAQYMLQTALTMNPDTSESATREEEQKMREIFLKESKHYLKKLSVKGYADAQYLLGDAYSSGAFGKVDNKEAFTLFQSAAKHGHIESAYRTAHCFEEGIGVTSDSRKALNFLKFAASRNHPSAMFKLGIYSFYGKMGLPNNVNTKQNGIKWLSRASARANELIAAAPYELAKIYEVGFLDIIIPDEKYAMELYIQAATLGHVPSSTLLGQIYETGNNTIAQDISLSVHYYTQAALKGDPVAMLGLCAWYLLGAEPAFTKDETEAFQWARKAAQAGYAKAQFTLGYFYEHGKGCPINIDSAWKWYERAANNNDTRAINKMNSKNSGESQSKNRRYKARDRKSARKTLSISTLNLFAFSDDTPKQKNNGNTNLDSNNQKKITSDNVKDDEFVNEDFNDVSNIKANENQIHDQKQSGERNNVSTFDSTNVISKPQSSDHLYVSEGFKFGNNNETNSDAPATIVSELRPYGEQQQNSVLPPAQSKFTPPTNSASVASNNTGTFRFAASSEPPSLLQKQNKLNKSKKSSLAKKNNSNQTKKDSKKDCIIM